MDVSGFGAELKRVPSETLPSTLDHFLTIRTMSRCTYGELENKYQYGI